MAKVIISPQALEDMDNIAEYITKDSPRYAGRMIERFLERIASLEKLPQIGRKVPEVNHENIRELLEGIYRIIYEITDADHIDILTIHHGNRLLSNSPAFR